MLLKIFSLIVYFEEQLSIFLKNWVKTNRCPVMIINRGFLKKYNLFNLLPI